MRLYEGTVQEFRKEVLSNNIADLISNKYKEYYHRKVNSSEFNSWNVSLRFLKDVLESSGLLKNRIVIEYELPYSGVPFKDISGYKPFYVKHDIFWLKVT